MTSTMTLSPIETIAQDIEDWGDGWRFVWNPDDKGRRARLERDMTDDLSVTIEIDLVGTEYYVHIGCKLRRRDGGRNPVSVSVRNPTTRKALDEINRRLDALEGVTP